MLKTQSGFPPEGELVLCTVTNVQHHSVFVRLEEYGSSGMIHISEVAPGRIRNIRDYVKEGKTVVCKVLRINRERGHIDLSLRRVTEGQRRNKIASLKQQQKAEKIVEFVAKKLKKEPAEVFAQVSEKLLEDYDDVFTGFMDVVSGELNLAKVGIDKDVAKELEATIKTRLKPEEVSVKGVLSLSSTAPDGVERVKKALAAAKGEKTELKYLGAGHYLIVVKGPDYKIAESVMSKATEAVLSAIQKSGGIGTFERQDS